MTNLNELKNAADYLIIATKEIGYTTPEQIEGNFDVIVKKAHEMITVLSKKIDMIITEGKKDELNLYLNNRKTVGA